VAKPKKRSCLENVNLCKLCKSITCRHKRRKQCCRESEKKFNYRVWDEALAKLQAPNLKFCASPTHTEDGSFLGMLQDAVTESAIASELVSDVLAAGLHDVWEQEARKWMDTGV
jgi:hypothetical protein